METPEQQVDRLRREGRLEPLRAKIAMWRRHAMAAKQRAIALHVALARCAATERASLYARWADDACGSADVIALADAMLTLTQAGEDELNKAARG